MVCERTETACFLPPRASTKKHQPILAALILCLLSMTSLMQFGPHPVHASSSVNVITNSSFEDGLNGWEFETCEGVANATATVDNSRSTDGTQSAKVSTGPVTPTGCFGPLPGRTVGFTQFRQFLFPGFNFTQLTDSPAGFSFWFQLQPYNNSGMAAFEVRIFGAEDLAELDYVFNPDPALGYVNNTSTHSLLFYGYQPDQWYHFSRDLRADWEGLGLNMTRNFTLVQFEGLALNIGGNLKSETFWLDDVRVYQSTGTVHDIAVESITAEPVSASTGTKIIIEVAVLNQGNASESFMVSVSQNKTLIGAPQSVVNLGPGSGTTFRLAWDTTGLTAGVYILKADATPITGETNIANNISPPTTVNLSANQPASPVNLQLTAVSRRAVLTWNPPRDNGGSPVIEYKVYRGTSLSQLYILATIGNTTTYEDNTVTNGQTYYYKVAAVNRAGMESAWENSSQGSILVPATASELPSNLLLWLALAAALIVAGALGGMVFLRRAKTSPKPT